MGLPNKMDGAGIKGVHPQHPDGKGTMKNMARRIKNKPTDKGVRDNLEAESNARVSF